MRLNHTLRLEWLCLVSMLVSGIVLSFLTPIYQVPDETAHFARAWQISEGIFLSPSRPRDDGKTDLISSVPDSFFQEKYTSDLFNSRGRYCIKDIAEFFSCPLNEVKRTQHRINNTGTTLHAHIFPKLCAASSFVVLEEMQDIYIMLCV